jgi:hypothetical protein
MWIPRAYSLHDQKTRSQRLPALRASLHSTSKSTLEAPPPLRDVDTQGAFISLHKHLQLNGVIAHHPHPCAYAHTTRTNLALHAPGQLGLTSLVLTARQHGRLGRTFLAHTARAHGRLAAC